MAGAAFKVLESLRVYVRRGEALIDCLDELKISAQLFDRISEADLDRLFEKLRWHRAAFHNFRVYDQLALKSGVNISDKDFKFSEGQNFAAVTILLSQAKHVETQLTADLAEINQSMISMDQRLGQARKQIKYYRSPGLSKSQLSKAI